MLPPPGSPLHLLPGMIPTTVMMYLASSGMAQRLACFLSTLFLPVTYHFSPWNEGDSYRILHHFI